jgi:hypothetical protein
MMLFRNTRIACLAVACTLAAGTFTQGQSATQLEKHARKIHHTLAKYPNGHYLHLVMRDASDSYGALGTLNDASFTFTSADSNSTYTYSYSDVDRVRTDKEAIGEGTEPRHRLRHLVPIVATAAVFGAAGAIYAVER